MDESTAPSADAPREEPVADGKFFNGWTWLAWGAALIVMYILGIGPAAVLHRNMPTARPAIEAVYKPLTLLADHCPPARTCLIWYVTAIWRLE